VVLVLVDLDAVAFAVIGGEANLLSGHDDVGLVLCTSLGVMNDSPGSVISLINSYGGLNTGIRVDNLLFGGSSLSVSVGVSVLTSLIVIGVSMCRTIGINDCLSVTVAISCSGGTSVWICYDVSLVTSAWVGSCAVSSTILTSLSVSSSTVWLGCVSDR
jgi:hypothetical protein